MEVITLVVALPEKFAAGLRRYARTLAFFVYLGIKYWFCREGEGGSFSGKFRAAYRRAPRLET